MNHTSFPGLQGVAERILHAPHILLGLDYDGTLTPIVEDPTQAFLPTRTRHVIEALSRRQDVAVAIVSGRAHADLQQRVGIPDLIYASNHGIEISGPGLRFVQPAAKASSRALHVLGLNLAKQLRHIQGALVEDKGLTLSVHFRRVAPVDGEEVRHTVLHAVELVNDRFHVTRGDKVYEIRPLVYWNKGAAVAWINEQLARPGVLVIYLGDDTTDEDAFTALGDNAITIKVGDGATTAARFRLADPAAVCEFLTWIDELLQRKPIVTTKP